MGFLANGLFLPRHMANLHVMALGEVLNDSLQMKVYKGHQVME